ncbi:MAG: O-antigen ligase family protein [Clostridiales bacterium]|nr:O-antigen ligase family protein [Clostridiales bacterium]MDY6117237.1 O-antigen ligase family protein [Anaerovoracaceae bacterium]
MHNLVCKKENIQVSSIAIIVAIISIIWIIQPAFPIARAGYITLAASIVCTAIAGCSNRKNFDISNLFKNPIFYFILTLGIMYTISSIIYSDRDRFVIGISIGLIMPICSNILDNCSAKKVFLHGFAIGNIISFIFLFFASLIFAPKIYIGQYYSIMLNPNGLSTAILPMLISSIYLIEKNRSKKAKIQTIFCLIAFSFIFSFLILSMSRTGLMGFLLTFLSYIIYLLINTRDKIYVLKMILTILFFSYIAFLLSSLAVTDLSTNILDIRASNSNKVYVFNKKNNGYIASKEVLKLIKNEDGDSIAEDLEKRLSKGSRDGEDISSGRLAIWKASIEQLNLHGHNNDEKFYVPKRHINTNDTHNIYLQIGYFIGIPAMILMWIIMMINIFRIIKCFFRRKHEKYLNEEQLFRASVITMFFVLSMLASVYIPIGSVIGMIFWMVSCWENKEKEI